MHGVCGSTPGAEGPGYRECRRRSREKGRWLTFRLCPLRRETLQLINKTHPVDSTLPSEAVQASLILGDVPRVRSAALAPLLPLALG